MKHRIFVAVNLPEDLKNNLLKYREKWPDLPVRWAKKEKIHITLAFLGYLSEEEILEVCQAVRMVAAKSQPFSISLNKIVYGPPKKTPPRMIWVEGESNKDLAKLQNELEKNLLEFRSEKRQFKPHITLGRIKTWQWKEMNPEERPEVNEEINLNFEVEAIEVMESFLKKTGPEYAVLESAKLGEEQL